MGFQTKDYYGIEDLLEIVTLLRSPEGCPWDREQTHRSIRRNFIEETYEAVEAIDAGDTGLLREELGDVLLQIALHAEMEREQGAFDFSAICDGICKKLILRHPHVFGETDASTTDQVLANWDAIKKVEKRQETRTDVLRGISVALPALMRTDKLCRKAAKSGFFRDGVPGAIADVRGELDELAQAVEQGDREHAAEELGDVLFAAVNLAGQLGTDPEESLSKACERFIGRFAVVEKLLSERDLDWDGMDGTLLDSLWQEAKNK